ncbi:MAG: hypothetical protein RR348_02690, partial [Clostridia bacterium]
MKKKRVALLISLVLVVALCLGIFVGCKTTGKTVISSGVTGGGKIQQVKDVDCLQSFAVQTVKDLTTAEFTKYFTVVEYTTGTSVKVNAAK